MSVPEIALPEVLDAATAPQVTNAILRALGAAPHAVRVNGSAVRDVDAAASVMLLRLAERVGRRVAVVQSSPELDAVFARMAAASTPRPADPQRILGDDPRRVRSLGIPDQSVL